MIVKLTYIDILSIHLYSNPQPSDLPLLPRALLFFQIFSFLGLVTLPKVVDSALGDLDEVL